MFTVVRLRQSKKQTSFFCRQKIMVFTEPVAKDGFHLVEAVYRGKKPHEQSIRQCLERLEAPVLLSGTAVIENLDGLVLCCDKRFRTLLLANAAASLHPESIAISDKFGEYSFILPTLVKNCRSVFVVTQNPAAYAAENIALFERFGASAAICESAPDKKFKLLFSPRNDSSRIDLPAEFLFGEGGYELTDADFTLPFEYERLLPHGTSRISFASALSNYAGAGNLDNLIPSSLTELKSRRMLSISTNCSVF